MTEAAELVVTLRGADVGLSALLRRIEGDLAKSDRAAIKAEQGAVQLAQAHVRLATAAERLSQAENQTAASTQRLAQSTAQTEAAQNRAAITALRLAREQEKVAQASSKSGVGALPRTFAGLTTEVQSAAAGMLSFGAALGAASALAQSFNDAIDFKANLDATNASVAIQLNGIRDSGAVFAEAQAYGDKYKLTQQEIADTVQASVGIFRSSRASVEDTFGVLQRLTVLAPGKSIADAAFSVRELASGDITSIAEQFNISRTKAYEMRDAINSGKDVVAVLAQFLDQSGVSMDALRLKTEGVLGAQRDLARATEELQLAQAAFATGPGLSILQAQIDVTRGATRLLTGEFGEMAASLQLATGNNDPLANIIASMLRGGQAASDYTDELARGTSGGTEWAAAQNQAATAANGMSAAIQTAAQTLAEEADKKALSAQKAQDLLIVQDNLARIGASVAAGFVTSAQAAAFLANQYGITTAQAEALISAQARLAGGQARLASQAAQTRNLATPGFNAPGRQGADESTVFATIKTTQATILQEEKKAEAARLKAAKTGGGARVSQEQKTQQQLASTVSDYQSKIAQIEKDGLIKRQAAENSLRQAQLSGRAGFYASLANIDDNALRQDLSARYEQAAAAAAQIAQTQGADAAQAYLEASQKAIEGEAAIQGQIADAKKAGNDGQAAYLEGVLKLQQAANAEELRQIQEKGSAIAAEQAAQYAQAEQQYAEHLERMGGIAAAKGVTLASTLPGATGGTSGGAPSAATVAGKPTAVVDIATPAAVDAQTGRLEGKLSEVVAELQAVKSEVAAVKNAVNNSRQSRATAGG